MADLLGFNLQLPKIQGFSSNELLGLILTLIIFILGSVIIFILYNRKIYNKRIVVFENIAGLGFQPSFYDKARTVKVGDGGEEILFLKKKKVYRTAYGRKMGANTYWFVIGQDGYWYNSVLGDLDAKMGMLDIDPIDKDVRYMHVAIRKNIQERYRKVGFMEKYGSLLMNGIFLIIMIAGIWFLLDKISGIASAVSGSVVASEKVAEASQKILSSLDNICGGSGIKPV